MEEAGAVLDARPAVDFEDHRVFPARVRLRGLEHPALDAMPFRHVHPELLGCLEVEGIEELRGRMRERSDRAGRGIEARDRSSVRVVASNHREILGPGRAAHSEERERARGDAARLPSLRGHRVEMRRALVAHQIVDSSAVHRPDRGRRLVEIAQVRAHEIQPGAVEIGRKVPRGTALRGHDPDMDVLYAPAVGLVLVCQEGDLLAVRRPRGREGRTGLRGQIPGLSSRSGNEPEVAYGGVIVGVGKPVRGHDEPLAVRRPCRGPVVPRSARERARFAGRDVEHVDVKSGLRQEALAVFLVVQPGEVHEGRRLPVLLLLLRLDRVLRRDRAGKMPRLGRIARAIAE